MFCHLSKINQQYIERISQWFCDYIFKWYHDIFRNLETHCKHVCVRYEAQEESFVCEKLKADSKHRKWSFRLCDLIWIHQKKSKKDCDSQKLINVNEN
jgi:hypothetical protein